MPGQQACPGPPQAEHVPSVPQVAPLLHVVPWQQACPTPPQAAHDPEMHMKPAAHIDPAQQGLPLPPQAPQAPPSQARPLMQVVPQQTWPAAPHATHSPPAQAEPVAVHVEPQQGWFIPPQAKHCPAEPHAAPAWQVVPQQGWPGAPHGSVAPPSVTGDGPSEETRSSPEGPSAAGASIVASAETVTSIRSMRVSAGASNAPPSTPGNFFGALHAAINPIKKMPMTGHLAPVDQATLRGRRDESMKTLGWGDGMLREPILRSCTVAPGATAREGSN